VAVDRALGVFGAFGDLLDGHRLPVVAVEQGQRRVEQRPLAAGKLPLFALGRADGRAPVGDCRSRATMRPGWLTGGKPNAGQPWLAP
jgi:hypothetical protein